MGLSLVTAPTGYPVALEEVLDHVRVDSDDDLAEVHRLMATVTELLDGQAGELQRCLLTQTWVWTFDRFPTGNDPLLVPLPRLQSVTSIQYVDTEGATQEWPATDYVVDTAREPGRIHRGYQKSWPSIRVQPDAVTVTYVAGYGDDWNSVPEPIRHAIMIMVAEFYDKRSETVVGAAVNQVPMASRALLARYQIYGP